MQGLFLMSLYLNTLPDNLWKKVSMSTYLTNISQGRNWPKEAKVINGSITAPNETPLAFENIDALFLAGAIPETYPPDQVHLY